MPYTNYTGQKRRDVKMREQKENANALRKRKKPRYAGGGQSGTAIGGAAAGGGS